MISQMAEAEPLIAKECRICYDSEKEDVISPCECKGSRKWICRECLYKVRQLKDKESCHICSKKFVFEKPTRKHKIMTFFRIIKDIISFLICIMMILLISFGLLYVSGFIEEDTTCKVTNSWLLCTLLGGIIITIPVLWGIGLMVILLQTIKFEDNKKYLHICNYDKMSVCKIMGLSVISIISLGMFTVTAGIVIIIQRRTWELANAGEIRDSPV